MKTIAVVLLSLMPPALPALAQTTDATAQIVVIGEGVLKATPNQAWLSIGAESRSKVSKEAQQRNADAMAAVTKRLTAFGIPGDAIKTTAIDLQMEFDYADGKQTPRGYVARNTLEVRVDDLAKLGEVLDAVVAAGATTIHGLRFDVKQRPEAEAGALQAAVKNAMAKAQAIAAGAGRSLGAILKIEEVSEVRGPMPMMRELAMSAQANPTPIAPGELEIRAQVRLTVAIR